MGVTKDGRTLLKGMEKLFPPIVSAQLTILKKEPPSLIAVDFRGSHPKPFTPRAVNIPKSQRKLRFLYISLLIRYVLRDRGTVHDINKYKYPNGALM